VAQQAMKRRLIRFITRGTVAAATVTLAAVTFGCGQRQPDLTADSIRVLVREAIEDHEVESQNRMMQLVMERVKHIAQQEIKRLNAAEWIYKRDVHEIPIHPRNNASYFKQFRRYDSYTMVDIVELPSVFLSFRLDIDYNYRLFRSEAHYRISDGDDAPNLAAAEKTFTDSGKTGSTEFSYTLDDELEWVGAAQQRGEIDLGSKARAIRRPEDRPLFTQQFNARWVPRAPMVIKKP